MKKAISILLAMAAALLSLSACDSKPRTEVAVVEEDFVLNNGSLVKEWIVEEIVPIPARKPAKVAEERPSKRHVWIPGEWRRAGDRWEWQSGRWRPPPTKNAYWMAGHWRMVDEKWHWTPGHWVVSSQQHYVSEMFKVPDLLPETRPEKPSDQHHWVAGYWDWDGRWYWINGYWTSKPHPDAEWIAAHWDEFGIDGGYRWIGGHWRVKT